MDKLFLLLLERNKINTYLLSKSKLASRIMNATVIILNTYLLLNVHKINGEDVLIVLFLLLSTVAVLADVIVTKIFDSKKDKR